MNGQLFVTDSGLETELIFHDGIDLPAFASFPLLDTDAGRARLRRYSRGSSTLARRHGVGRRSSRSATWRANPDWADPARLRLRRARRINRRSIDELMRLRDENPDLVAAVVSGTIGPRGDGYAPATHMTADEAEAYHGEQIAHVRGGRRRPRHRLHDLSTTTRRSASPRPQPPSACRWRSRSRSRPTGGCRAASRSATAIQAVDAATDGRSPTT